MHWIALQPLPEPPLAEGEFGPGTPGSMPGGALGAQAARVDGLADGLTALGWWALQFTPKVARVETGEGGEGVLVMEVSASERLFGGRKLLFRRIYQSNKPLAIVKYTQAATSLIAIAKLQIEPAAPASSSASSASFASFASPPSSRAPANAAARRKPVKPPDSLLDHPLPGSLPDSLPLTTLAAACPHLSTLARIGCTTWGQLRALPRGGVARRFGAELLDVLDRAYGTKPELYPWLVLPEVFEAKLELAARIDNAPALMFGARRLLAQLHAWLQARQHGILALELGWELDARRQDASTGHLVLRTAEPTLDTAHVQRLLAENLARVTLHAPALYLRLRSLETAALPGASVSLLPDDARKGDSLHHLLERLSARLGADHVLRVVPHADHRPERMQVWQAASTVSLVSPVSPRSRVAPSASTSTESSFTINNIANYSYRTWKKDLNDPLNHQKTGARPLNRRLNRPLPRPLTQADALYPTWLLAQPLKLAVRNNAPQCSQGGPLTLLAGPQRVEAGWWSGQKSGDGGGGRGGRGGRGDASTSSPCALRDYFLARSNQMGLLWIYRERLGGQGSAGQPAQGRADSGGDQNADGSDWYLHGLFA